MTDAPERIRVAQDADGFWTCREAVSGSQEYVRADLYAALEAQLAVARKALEEISEPETVWRRRAAEDGIRLAAADIVALMRQRTPEVIARTALRKLDRQRVKAAKEASDD